MEQKHFLKFRKNQTIVLLFDLEFYVPLSERDEKLVFQANPYRNAHFLIGGTFIQYYPLNAKKSPSTHEYWIWNYKTEKEMLEDIIKLFKESWDIISSGDGKSELIVSGIGIGRVDIAYLFGRCMMNQVENNETLFSCLNRLRVVDLENVAIPYFKSKNELLYPKNTSEINQKFKIKRKREVGTLIWDYYDKKEYSKILERNNNEVKDQLEVYKEIAKINFIKNLAEKYSVNSFNDILEGLKSQRDKDYIMCYYKINEETGRYCLKEDVDNEIKYKLMKLIFVSGYYYRKDKRANGA